MNEDERVEVYQQIYDLTVSNNRKDKEIERLGNELQVQIEDNVRLNEYIDEKDKEIERLNKEIKEKDNEIIRLDYKYGECKKQELNEYAKNRELHSIIKEVREEIKQYKEIMENGIEQGAYYLWIGSLQQRLEKILEILDKENKE